MEEYYNLTYIQIITLMHKLDEIKKTNPYFNDPISNSFEKNMVEMIAEFEIQSVKYKMPKASKRKYKVSKSMVDYITNITDIDIFDKKSKKENAKRVKKLEKKIIGETRKN